MPLCMLHVHTLPLLVPTAIEFPDTAEQPGRYSRGNHNRFCELYVIHTAAEFKPTP